MTTEIATIELTDIGLDERAQKVYLALLELGVDSVQNIAKKAAVERTGVYGVLVELIRLGLVSETKVGKKRAFVAENPARLSQLAAERQKAVEGMLPALQSLWQATDVRPRMRYYEGREGMRSVIEDTLTAPDKQLLGILSAEDLYAAVGERWFEDYTKRRIKENFSLRVVRTQAKDLGERWPSSTTAKRELRYAPDGMVFSMTIYIYGNKVAILSTRKENFALVIESDEYAQTQRLLFEALWQISTKTDRNP